MKILPIVEGIGDVAAVPVLIRRLLAHHGLHTVNVLRPYRFGEVAKVSKNFRRNVLTAAKERAAILWVLDCDDGCAVEWVRILEEQIPAELTVPLSFAFFVREYESLFLAEQQCLVSQLGVPATSRFPDDPESIRGAKEYISRLMPAGLAYKESVHQARLTGHIDLNEARRTSRSFRHLEKALVELSQTVDNG
jgi:hypothetical protein